ncbi:hypothetical protein PGTUg99_012190 [Puccinia graminis f. sp. tritici]|uniref:Uncharacterized protein n=1 Tax=Puccinia graminis f. sp. tritici TaxID=56615 RepID=A0A5B0M9X8_PUCGR|nr:hypothetical protein PGTUg99_012190 [Puccinia graminis f. sp. tritici]
MDRAILELTETALSHLTPQDQLLFDRFFTNFQDAYLELFNHPLRGAFTDEEDAYFGRYVNRVIDALDRLGREDVQRLEFIWFYWIGMIEDLEESRAVTFARRRTQIEERLDTLPIITSPTLTSIPDGESLGCLVAWKNLPNPKKS